MSPPRWAEIGEDLAQRVACILIVLLPFDLAAAEVAPRAASFVMWAGFAIGATVALWDRTFLVCWRLAARWAVPDRALYLERWSRLCAKCDAEVDIARFAEHFELGHDLSRPAARRAQRWVHFRAGDRRNNHLL